MRSYARFNKRLARRYDEWMVAMHYAGVTQRIYRRVIRQFTQFLGKKSLAAVTHIDVRSFIARLSEDGASLAAVYRALGVLRTFYDFLNLGGVVSYVAPRYVKLRRPWWTGLAPLSESQVQRLIAATRTARERAIVEFFYATGCRLSEAIHVKVEDFDFQARTVRLRGKLGKVRTAFLTNSAIEALQSYIGDRQTGIVFRRDWPVQKGGLTTHHGSWISLFRDYGGPKAIYRKKNLGRVALLSYEAARKKHEELLSSYNLVGPGRDAPLSKFAVQQLIRKIAGRAGLKKVTPHTLRRTFATHLYDHGATVEVIKTLMGHVWIQTTMKYMRISLDRLADTYDRCHPRGTLDDQASH